MRDYNRLTKRDVVGTCVNIYEFANEVKKWQERHGLYDYMGADTTQILLERLADLEDKIENGTLIELPCKVGQTIYHLYKAGDVITEDKVFNYHFEICSKPCVFFENLFWYGTRKRVLVEHFGKYWFTDKAEAEAKLRELKGEKQWEK